MSSHSNNRQKMSKSKIFSNKIYIPYYADEIPTHPMTSQDVSLLTLWNVKKILLVSAVVDDLWLAFCSYIRTYVSSTYYLILIFIFFGTPRGRQKKIK